MNTLLALTITIPDWLFDERFWLGFCSAAGFGIAFLLYAMSKFKNFNPFDR
jgi:hypothetical protein